MRTRGRSAGRSCRLTGAGCAISGQGPPATWAAIRALQAGVRRASGKGFQLAESCDDRHVLQKQIREGRDCEDTLVRRLAPAERNQGGRSRISQRPEEHELHFHRGNQEYHDFRIHGLRSQAYRPRRADKARKGRKNSAEEIGAQPLSVQSAGGLGFRDRGGEDAGVEFLVCGAVYGGRAAEHDFLHTPRDGARVRRKDDGFPEFSGGGQVRQVALLLPLRISAFRGGLIRVVAIFEYYGAVFVGAFFMDNIACRLRFNFLDIFL